MAYLFIPPGLSGEDLNQWLVDNGQQPIGKWNKHSGWATRSAKNGTKIRQRKQLDARLAREAEGTEDDR